MSSKFDRIINSLIIVFFAILLIAMFFLFIIGIPSMVIVENYPHETTMQQVTCEDKDGDEIIGVKCVRENKCRNDFWGYFGNSYDCEK